MGTISEADMVLHDLLVDVRPPDAPPHGPANCLICATREDDRVTTTDADALAALQAAIDQAVTAATGPLTARIAELETAAGASAQDAAISAAVAEATAPLQTQVSELQAQLDTAEAARVAAEQRVTDIETFLTAEAETATAAARADERAQAVTDLNLFGQEHIDRNRERWAALDDTAWAEQLVEYQALAATRGGPVTPPLPGTDPASPPAPVTATAVTGGETSALRRVLELRDKVDAKGDPIRIAGTVG